MYQPPLPARQSAQRPVVSDPHLRKVWGFRVLAIACIAGALAWCVPLIWALVSAGVGLLALGCLGLLALACVQALPLAMQRIENRWWSLRKAEAQANPIEQLQNDCLRREQRLRSFRNALVTIGGQIETLADMLVERKNKDPQQVLARQERALEKMRHFYEVNVGRLEEAHLALDAFRQVVLQKGFEWEFARAGQAVMSALNPHEVDALAQDLLSDAALQSVQTRFNTVFTELDIEMRSVEAPVTALIAPQRPANFFSEELSDQFETRSQR